MRETNIVLTKDENHILKVTRKAVKYYNKGCPLREEFEMSKPRIDEGDACELLVKIAKILEL